MHLLIAIVGMCGAGKSVVADMLVERGFSFVRFGQITLDIVKERGLAVSEENEKRIREEVRQEHGMGAFATLNIPKFDKLLAEGNVAADGLYSWNEYKVLKEKYGDRLVTLLVYASPKTRYSRLANRKLRPEDTEARFREISPEKAKARDMAEIENIEKGGPIAMADYTIINEGSLEELQTGLNAFIEWVGKNG